MYEYYRYSTIHIRYTDDKIKFKAKIDAAKHLFAFILGSYQLSEPLKELRIPPG